MFDHIITLSLNPAIDATFWVDRVEVGGDNTVRYQKYEAAGRAMNVSRALGLYGIQTHALVLAGTYNRIPYENPLKAEGIQYTIIPIEGYTRENITVVDGDRTVTRFLREGLAVPYEALSQLLELLSQVVKERTLVVISGALPAGISEKQLLDICLTVKEHGGLVALDTSARFTSQDLEKIQPWLIKPNLRELEGIARRELPDTQSIVTFCRELESWGVRHCLVSMGESGVLYTGEEGVYQVMVPNVSVVSAVGSGDYCLAGFVLGQATGKSLLQSLVTAASFGTAACMTEGTSPPTRIATASIMNQVICEKLA